MRQYFIWIVAGLMIGMLVGPSVVSLGAEGKWTRKADMPTVRDALSASVVNGKVYAIGGAPNKSLVLSTVEEYDPATDTWEKKKDMPTPRKGASTSVVNGIIYAIGGRGAAGKSLSVVEEYNPATDTWIRKADMPTARQRLSTSMVDGKIYAIGGTGDNGLGLPTVEVYDPATDTWERKTDMPTARGALAAGAVNGKIYAFGGRTVPPQNGGATLSTVEEYDPVTDTWEKKKNMPRANVHFRVSVVEDKLYVISGSNFQTYFSNVEAYDPAADTWEKKANIPTARSRPGVSAVDGRIYVMGGRTWGDAFLSTVEEYDTGLVPSQEPQVTQENEEPKSVAPKGKLITLWGTIKRNN